MLSDDKAQPVQSVSVPPTLSLMISAARKKGSFNLEDDEDHDASDENSAVNKYHAAGLGQAEMNAGSFAHASEEEDGVEGLPDGQVDLADLPSAFANATERPRALTIHDTNVQSQGPGKPP